MKNFFFFSIIFFPILNGQSAVNLIAIRVEFKEDQSSFTSGNGKFDLRIISSPDSVESIIIDPSPHNKSYFEDHLLFAKNYFAKLLNIQLNYVVFPIAENSSYQLSKQMTAYNPNREDDNLQSLVELYKEAYLLAENNGATIHKNDIVVIFHAGTGNDIYQYFNDTPHDIPSLALSEKLIDRVDPSWKLNRSVRGVILPETMKRPNYDLALNGMVTAQIGTQLGLLDFIDSVKKRTSAGPWELEDRGLFNAAGLLPSIPSAYNRLRLHPKPQLKTFEAEFNEKTLQISYPESLDSINPKIIKIPLNKNEYYLIEYRYRPIYQGDEHLDLASLQSKFTPANQPFINLKQVLKHSQFTARNQFEFSSRGVLIDATYFDAAIPHSGIAIWHVDSLQIEMQLNLGNSINDDSEYRGVKLVEADGVDNYDTGGDGFNDERYDLFYANNKAKYYQNHLSDKTNPSSNSHYEFSETGIALSEFSKPDNVMSFKLKRNNFFYYLKKNILGIFKYQNNYLMIQKDSTNFKIYQFSFSNDFQFIIEDSLIVTGNFICQNEQLLYYFQSSKIVAINWQTKISNDIFTLDSIEQVVFTKPYFLIQTNSHLILEGMQRDTIDQSIDYLTVLNGNASYGKQGNRYLLSNGTFTKMPPFNFQTVININKQLLYLNWIQNKMTALDENEVIAYNFPYDIAYRKSSSEISEITQDSITFSSFDSRNNLKLFHPSDRRNLLFSFNFGLPVISKFYDAENQRYFFWGDSILVLSNDIKIEFQFRPEGENKFAGNGLNKNASFIWPNPVKETTAYLRLVSSLNELCDITILTANGIKITTMKTTLKANLVSDISINVSQYSKGLYLALVQTKSAKKLIKFMVL